MGSDWNGIIFELFEPRAVTVSDRWNVSSSDRNVPDVEGVVQGFVSALASLTKASHVNTTSLEDLSES